MKSKCRLFKGNRKKVIATLTAAAIVFSGISFSENRKVVSAAGVKKAGYTLSKKAGVYQKSIKIKITVKKGYKLYYSLNGNLQLKKVIHSGKSKCISIKSTKTLSVYCVKKAKKVKASDLKKKSLQKKIQTYKYVIRKQTDSQKSDSFSTSEPSSTNDSGTEADDVSSSATKQPETTDIPSAATKQPETTSVPSAATKQPETTDIPSAATKQPETTSVPSAATKQPETTSVPSAAAKQPETTGIPSAATELSGNVENAVEENTSSTAIPAGTEGTAAPGGTTDSEAEITSSHQETIDLSSLDGVKVNPSDTEYTYKKSKKNKIQIMAPGTYTINGNGKTIDGLIVVDFGEKYDTDGDGTDDTSYETSESPSADGVNIILNNITLTDTNADFDINTSSEMTSDDGIIKIKSSDYMTGVKITIQDTVTLADTGVTGVDKDDASDITYPAGILSKKTPLEIDGTGTLTITSSNGNGIKSTSSLKIVDTVIQIGTNDVAVGHHGITAKTELISESADITVYSNGDGLKTTYDASDVTDSSHPYEPVMKITGGNLIIDAKNGDGISASYTLNEDTSDEKSYGTLVLAPETLKVTTTLTATTDESADDAIHGNGDINISGGTLNLSAADDGIHADGTLTINGGKITVTKSYEGLEGNDIIIHGGNMEITSSDDGLNAAGGSDSQSLSQDHFRMRATSTTSSDGSYKGIKAGSFLVITSGEITVDTTSTGTKKNSDGGGMSNTADINHAITIDGGKITVNAEGDGIDSNGNLYISGGEIVVYGPSSGGNGSLDIGDGSGCVFEINGGTLWAFAGTSDMAVTPTSANPGYLVYTLSSTISAGQTATVKSSLTDIDSITVKKAAKHVLYYSSSISTGNNYSLYAGSSSLGTSSVYTSSSSTLGGGIPGNPGGGAGGPGGR